MLQRLLLAILLWAPFTSSGSAEYRPPFYERAMANIQAPLLRLPEPVGPAAAAFQETLPTAGFPQYRPFHVPAFRSPERAVRGLIPGGILLTVLGGAGIALGAATLSDSQDKAVSISLIVSSSLLALIGAGLIIAGAGRH
jgi:hypothetical protein